MAHTLNWEPRGVSRVFSGEITAREVLASNLELQGKPAFDTIRYVLNDFSAITGFTVTQLDIEAIAAIDDVAAKSNPRIKIAIIAMDDGFLAWVQLYCRKMEGSPFECEIFNSTERARDWLGQT